MAPPRACTRGVRCPHTVTSDKPCPVHGVVVTGHRWDTDRRQDVARIRGRRLQGERRALFNREPVCRLCAAKGVMTLAVVRDHIVPLGEGGMDTPENTQPLCQDCSDAKTHTESMRGRRR